jgi:hypothetical protein
VAAALVVATAVTVPLVLRADPGSTAATPLRWTQVGTPSLPAGFVPSGLDCPDATTCLALVGSNRGAGFQLIHLRNGAVESATPVELPPGGYGVDQETELDDLSCVTATDCWAVGTNGAPWHWNGHDWAIAAGGVELYGKVSCLHGQFCVTTGESEQSSGLFRTDGATLTSLGGPADPRNPARSVRPDAVACSAANSCLAVANSGHVVTAWRYDGKTWAPVSDGSSHDENGTSVVITRVDDLTCPPGSDTCFAVVAVQTDPEHSQSSLAAFTAAGWTVKPLQSSNWWEWKSVTCVSAHACFAAGAIGIFRGSEQDYDNVAIDMYDGHSWVTSNTTALPASMIDHVACPSPTECYGAGYTGWLGGSSEESRTVIAHGVAA